MSGRRIKRAILVTIASLASMLVVAACTIKLRGDSSGPSGGSSASGIANPIGAELERCRKITSEQVVELQECRLIWAENRRRFLGSKKAAQMGRAPVATPGRE